MADENDKVDDDKKEIEEQEELDLEVDDDQDDDQDDDKGKDKKKRGRPSKEELRARELEIELETLRKYHKKANKEAEKYRHEAKQWRELGVEPDKVSELIKQQEEAEIKAAEERQDWETLREKMIENHKKDLQKKEDEAEQFRVEKEQMEKSLERYMVDAELTSEAAQQGIKSPKLLMPHIRNKVKAIKKDDGLYGVGILDDNGDVIEGATIKDLFENAKQDDDLASLFPAPDSGGSGGNQSNQRTTTDNGSVASLLKKRKSELTQEEKLAIISSKGGATKYAQMKP